MDSDSEIQGYNVYPMLHFHRKFSSSITTKQSEDPESTKALTDTGNREDESMTSKEFKLLSVAASRCSVVALTSSRQLTFQDRR